MMLLILPFKPKQTGCRLENKPTLLSQSHFLSFTLLPSLTRCASHRTPCRLRGELEIRNAILLHLLIPLPLPPPPPLLPFPNGSYQTHQDICDRTMRRLPPTSPEVEDYECKCFASVHFLSVHARALFLHKLKWIMGGSLISTWGSFGELRKRQDTDRYYSYFTEPVKGPWCNLKEDVDNWMALCHESVSIIAHAC